MDIDIISSTLNADKCIACKKNKSFGKLRCPSCYKGYLHRRKKFGYGPISNERSEENIYNYVGVGR